MTVALCGHGAVPTRRLHLGLVKGYVVILVYRL